MSADWISHIRKLDNASAELKRHKLLLLVKGLHEIGHILTPIFMLQLGMPKKNNLYTTPIKIGTMNTGTTKKTKKVIGDAGYGLEECLSGGRMFHEHPRGEGLFAIEVLVLEKKKPDGGKWKKFEISDKFVNKPKTFLSSYLIEDNMLIDFKSKASSHKRKSAELFIPNEMECKSSFRCTTSDTKYRRV